MGKDITHNLDMHNLDKLQIGNKRAPAQEVDYKSFSIRKGSQFEAYITDLNKQT